MSAGFFKDIRGNSSCTFFGGNSSNCVGVVAAAKPEELTKSQDESNSSIGPEFEVESRAPKDDDGSQNEKGEPKKELAEPAKKEPQRNKLFTPKLFTSKEGQGDGKVKEKKHSNHRKEKMQVHTPVTSFENLSGRSFSDLLGQLEAASFSSEKQLEEKRRKLKEYEKVISQKEKEIQNLVRVNADLSTKVTDLSGTVESIHTELATLREQKNGLEKTCDKNGEELAHYKKKINDLVCSTEGLRSSLKAIKSQVRTQSKVQDAELSQKALQIDQLSGMLSEEKLKSSDLLKKLTSKSEWEARAAAEHAELGSILEKKLGNVQSALQKITNESHELITGLEACICTKNEYVVDMLKEIFANGVSTEATRLMIALESGRETGVSRVVSELHEVTNKIEHQLCENEGRIATSYQQSVSEVLRILEEQCKEKVNYDLQVNQLRARIVELEDCIREKAAEISVEKGKHDEVAGKLQEEIHHLQLALMKHETSTEMLERELKEKSAALEKQNAVLESMKSTSLEKEKISLQEVAQAHATLEEREKSYTALRDKTSSLEQDVSNLQSACHGMKQSIESMAKRIEDLEREKRECAADLEELTKRESSLAMKLEKREQDVVKLETQLRDEENTHSREIDKLQKVLQLEREKGVQLEQANRESAIKEELFDNEKKLLEKVYKDKVSFLEGWQEETNKKSSILIAKMDELKEGVSDQLTRLSAMQNSGFDSSCREKESTAGRMGTRDTSVYGSAVLATPKQENRAPRAKKKRTTTTTTRRTPEEDIFSLDKITSSPPKKRAKRK